MSIREAKGREIADRARIVKEGNLYLVPSQSGKGKYKVRPDGFASEVQKLHDF